MGNMISHGEEDNMAWHVAMGCLCIGYSFPWACTVDFVLKYRAMSMFRLFTFMGSVIGIFWALEDAVLDSMIYFVIIAFVNLAHMAMAIAVQPQSCFDLFCCSIQTTHMEDKIHTLYHGKFGGPNTMDRREFELLTEDRAVSKSYERGHHFLEYAKESKTLSILLSGKMGIYEKSSATARANDTAGPAVVGAHTRDILTGYIYPMDFVNHLEWIAHEQGNTTRARVTIKCEEDCTVLEWDRTHLAETFKQYPRIQCRVTSFLGKEIAEKAQLISGGRPVDQHSEFVHHVYCGAKWQKRKGAHEMMRNSDRHPEAYWNCSDFVPKLMDMTDNYSYRTLKLKPEQWLMRYALGEGPWVDFSTDKLSDGLATLLGELQNLDKKSAEYQYWVQQTHSKLGKIARMHFPSEHQVDGIAPGQDDIKRIQKVLEDNRKPSNTTQRLTDQNYRQALATDIGGKPWVNMFAVVATKEINELIPRKKHSTASRTDGGTSGEVPTQEQIELTVKALKKYKAQKLAHKVWKDPTKGKSDEATFKAWRDTRPKFETWWKERLADRGETQDEEDEDWGKKDHKQWEESKHWGTMVDYTDYGKPMKPDEDNKPQHTHFRALEELLNSKGGNFFKRTGSHSSSSRGPGVGSGNALAPPVATGGSHAARAVIGGNVAAESITPAPAPLNLTNNQFYRQTSLPIVPMTLLDWVRYLHRHREMLQEQIKKSITSEEFVDMEFGGLDNSNPLHERIRLHVIESDFVKSVCEQTWQTWKDCSKSPELADAKILNPHKVRMALKAAKISARKSAARMTNARLLSVDPAVLDTTRPVEKTSAVALKYFEPLFEHLQAHMPSMSTRELLELMNWGKWRVLWKPGTVFVRQHESPHVVGIVMEGLLASYTEDEVTSSRSFVNMIRQRELVGSEDFQLTMFNTARRTIEVPTLEAMQDLEEDGMISKKDIAAQFKNYKDEHEPKQLQLSRAELGDPQTDPLFWTAADAGQRFKDYIEDLGLEIDENLVEGLQADYEAREAWDKTLKEMQARENKVEYEKNKDRKKDFNETETLSRPTVMFVWESEDIRRLMEVDPRTKQAMSVMLGFDLNSKQKTSVNLGSRFCGFVTHASGDDGTERPMCGNGDGIQQLRAEDIQTLSGR